MPKAAPLHGGRTGTQTSLSLAWALVLVPGPQAACSVRPVSGGEWSAPFEDSSVQWASRRSSSASRMHGGERRLPSPSLTAAQWAVGCQKGLLVEGDLELTLKEMEDGT